jgi:selenocysteine lyase/cysteine desulfurase
VEDVDGLAELLHQHGALACFDYAGAGAYVPVSLAAPAGRPLAYKDAVALSPHKMLGGPGACGLLVARRRLFGEVPTLPGEQRTGAVTAARGLAVRAPGSAALAAWPSPAPSACPLWPRPPPARAGGGTVLFVSPERHQYLPRVEEREEAGTPHILGALRCGLAFSLRAGLGAGLISELSSLAAHALLASLRCNPRIVLLGGGSPAYHDAVRLPIVRMLVRVPEQAAALQGGLEAGRLMHHGFVARLLNDVYGLQARSGCSCAGPLGHALLKVSSCASRQQQELAAAGEACVKAGWTRVSLSFTSEPLDVEYVAAALHQVWAPVWVRPATWGRLLREGRAAAGGRRLPLEHCRGARTTMAAAAAFSG